MLVDLLFKGVTVVDGTGRPGFRASVAVKGDRIVAVGDLAGWKAMRLVKGAGMVLCPGFVDMHGHSDYFLLLLPRSDSKIRQGITTEVGGNCGYSAAPITDKLSMEFFDFDVKWNGFGDYLARLEEAWPAINYAPLVGFNNVRALAMGHSAEPPDRARLASMRSIIRECMEAGCFGMSLGLIYPPGMFAAMDELIECAREVAAAGGIISSHMRSEGKELVEAVKESIAIARGSGARFQISHLKTEGRENWHKLDQVLDLIEEARAEGLSITADCYPYTSGSSGLTALLPEWVQDGGREAMLGRLADPAARREIEEQISTLEWDKVTIAQVFNADHEGLEGMTILEAAAKVGVPPAGLAAEMALRSRGQVAVIYETTSEENLRRIMTREWVMVGSDSPVRTHYGPLAKGRPHPRAYGAMPRMLAWVAREKGWLSLHAAVKKMTLDPCRVLGLSDRGVIRPGAAADLTLFDPETVQDLATYADPKQYPEGVQMVVVNGRVALQGPEYTGDRSGKVISRPDARDVAALEREAGSRFRNVHGGCLPQKRPLN